jgi:hypothetical protein
VETALNSNRRDTSRSPEPSWRALPAAVPAMPPVLVLALPGQPALLPILLSVIALCILVETAALRAPRPGSAIDGTFHKIAEALPRYGVGDAARSAHRRIPGAILAMPPMSMTAIGGGGGRRTQPAPIRPQQDARRLDPAPPDTQLRRTGS